ncbi:MAG TPA: amidohydrolase [Clostridia bacterium]|nr:MAG: N-acetyldiaminopimelate deacetylase [Firmicutes bacterium ADurb.Bin248]HOG01382.1 amidohydrolase [Clostridia bacterium]HOS18270.1 amidohydrolase [Clostridia bacterium]HPK15335.1 amidohydrolase [Clostridia bacterium]
MDIRFEVQSILPELARVRRDLHAMPEDGYREFETSNYVYDYLSALAPDRLEKLAGTGVKAVFFAKDAKRTTAFRADMDALPVSEDTGLPFASKNPGFMHACGHDAHMAAALLTAALAARHRDELTENAVFLFQPAEEGMLGALGMISDGALEAPHVDRIFGFHVYPGIPEGKIALREGPMMARATGLNLTVRGRSAHGAKPHLGNDAVVAAAALVTMLETLVSRKIDPMENAVLTIGTIAGGTRRNIICDEVKLTLTMRTFTDEVYDAMMAGIRGMLEAVEHAFGVTSELAFEGQDYLAVVNDPELAREYRRAAGDAAIETGRVCISEDFSFYQRKTKGLFVFLGVGEDVEALHTPRMFFDERALLPAIEAYLRLLRL